LLHPEIANSAVEAAPLLPRECPEGPATWQLASYNWKTNATNGLSQRQEEVVVVGEAKGKWTTVSLRFYAENDAPLQIAEWNVLGSKTRPEALVFIDQYEAGGQDDAYRPAAASARDRRAGLLAGPAAPRQKARRRSRSILTILQLRAPALRSWQRSPRGRCQS
jgi:hypothetical protein